MDPPGFEFVCEATGCLHNRDEACVLFVLGRPLVLVGSGFCRDYEKNPVNK